MSFSIQADGNLCECHVTDSEVIFSPESSAVKLKVEDIIGCEIVSTSWLFNRPALNLWHIVQKDDNVLIREKIQITGEENVWRNLENEINNKLNRLTKRPKSLMVLINPIGGKKRGVQEYQNTVSPIFKLANIKCDVQVSNKSKHMVETMTNYDTSGIDGVVVLGGDGSFSEVANVLLRKAQEEEGVEYNDPAAKVQPIKIPITVIPTGTGNYVAARASGCRDIVTSALHVVKGNISHLNIIAVHADDKLVNYSTAGTSYGLTTEMLYLADEKYRWLGYFRYFAIPLRILLFQSAFKTYNLDVTCYTPGTETNGPAKETNGPAKEEKDGILVNGRKLQRAKIQDCTEDTVSFQGKYVDVLAMDGNMVDLENNRIDWNHLYRQPQNIFSTMFSNDKITVSKMFMQTKAVMNQGLAVEADYYDIVNIRGLKVRVMDKDKCDGGDEDQIRHLLQVDGEMFPMQSLKFEFWLHEKIVPVFSSFRG